MSWNDIIGQNHVKEILQKAFIEHKVPHAYCFWGNEGIGKEAAAIEFAKLVNCDRPFINDEQPEACGNCKSCRQASILQHPNIQIIFSLPTPKGTETRDDSPLAKMSDEQIAAIQQQIRLKAEDPYHIISLQNANIIRISSVRELKRNLVLSANQQGRRVIIVAKADEMTNEAANAFLKTLEEPHENITIILTTSKKDLIPPTILSRCQLIHFEPLSDEDIMAALTEKHGLETDEARLIASVAQGSYLTALSFRDSGMKELREEVVSILRIALKKKLYRVELLRCLDKFFKEKDRKKNEALLILLLVWLRDVYSVLLTGDTDLVINIYQVEIIQKFKDAFHKGDLASAILAVELAVIQLRRNVQPQLVFINLFIKLREYLF